MCCTSDPARCTFRVVLFRIHVGAAPRQQHRVAAGQRLLYIFSRLIQVDADRLPACLPHRIFILRQRAFGVLAVARVRNRNCNARLIHRVIG
jgi:hypothetical protein